MSFKNKLSPAIAFAFVFVSVSFTSTGLRAQERSVTVYQYRRVPADKAAEFIKRETTYWSKVADKAVKAKKMSFWALLEKVGGYDLPNNSNYLFVNTFPDIDKLGDVFSNVESIAGVKMAAMETGSMSTTTSEFYLHEEDWAQAAKANPAKDFNYIVLVYHNSSNADSTILLEKSVWHPFIQKAMDAGQTPQLGWGNARLLAPMGDNIKFTTVSYDLYKNLGDALNPQWAPNMVYPAGLGTIGNLEMNRRGLSIYRIVKVVSAN